jgi:riboflavin synthase
VVEKGDKSYVVTAVQETLLRSNLGLLKEGDLVNVERSMLLNGRLDGHIVQGHVDQTAVCTRVEESGGSWRYGFEYAYDKELASQGYTTVEKGSVCVNGVSLTVCRSGIHTFEVAIIPYTYEHTNFGQIEKGSVVNLEFDIIGKYLSKLVVFK